jgi:hypothetical protein
MLEVLKRAAAAVTVLISLSLYLVDPEGCSSSRP